MASWEGDADRTRVRALSKLIFGNADRLEVAAAIAREPEAIVNGDELANQLTIAPNRVRAQLLAFTEAGFLSPVPRVDRRVYYERRASPFWDLVLAVLEEA